MSNIDNNRGNTDKRERVVEYVKDVYALSLLLYAGFSVLIFALALSMGFAVRLFYWAMGSS